MLGLAREGSGERWTDAIAKIDVRLTIQRFTCKTHSRASGWTRRAACRDAQAVEVERLQAA
jgi:hypothetical protein